MRPCTTTKQKHRSSSMRPPDVRSSGSSCTKNFQITLWQIPEESRMVMQKIQDSDYENHVGGWSLPHKAINQGYYWLKMFDNAKKHVRKFQQYQRFAPASNRPSKDLYILRSPWTFMLWGLDIVSPLPRVSYQFRFLLVATNHFIKWTEVVPLSKVMRQQIMNFLWQNIICRFGLPYTIISDNGTNSVSMPVANFCTK